MSGVTTKIVGFTKKPRSSPVRQDQVRRLAAQLLRDALDRWRGGRGDRNAGTGGAGEGNHADILMRGDGVAHGRAVAVDQVERPRGHARLVQDVRQHQRADRRELRGFQHHRASRRKGRGQLVADQLHRPVPRRDEAGDADRLTLDDIDALAGLEFVRSQRLYRLAQRGEPRAGLLGQPLRRPHLFGERRHQRVLPGGVDLDDALQKRDPRRLRLRGEVRQNAQGGLHRPVDLRRAAKRDGGEDRLGRRVDQLERRRVERVDPGAADIDLSVVLHASIFRAMSERPRRCARVRCR